MKPFVFLLAALIVFFPPLAGAQDARHVPIYKEKGRFGGWPANHGAWIWGNEIVVGFSRGYYKDLGAERHNIDRDKPEQHLLARSVDGGETWTIEDPASNGYLIPQGEALHGVELPGVTIKPAVDCPGGIDFTHPDFALTARMSSSDAGASRFYYSLDRAKTWKGPFKLPLFDQPGVMARTDYIVYGPDECLLVLTASKSNGQEGRPFCARTTDGGKTWTFLGFIGPEPKGYAIMPSTVRLDGDALLTAIRVKEDGKSWIDAYASDDRGATWTFLNRAAPDTGEGNPASMIRLQDGRVCLTYGYRAAPFGMRARISGDGGNTWGDEIHLRDDGSGRDLGYPRTVQRPDGALVTMYYYQDAEQPERYIAATMWRAD